MIEPFKESNGEVEQVVEENGIHNGDHDHSLQPDTNILPELNLLIVFLSLISASNDDSLYFVEEEKKSVRDNEATVHSRRREMNEVKFVGRPPPRFQAIKDLRHCRRM